MEHVDLPPVQIAPNRLRKYGIFQAQIDSAKWSEKKMKFVVGMGIIAGAMIYVILLAAR